MEQPRFTAPPIPAPYLAGVPTLPPALGKALNNRGRPTRQQLAEARRFFGRIRQLIREARERYESESGWLIEPEPPPAA